jgi:hypothetical protein
MHICRATTHYFSALKQTRVFKLPHAEAISDGTPPKDTQNNIGKGRI